MHQLFKRFCRTFLISLSVIIGFTSCVSYQDYLYFEEDPLNLTSYDPTKVPSEMILDSVMEDPNIGYRLPYYQTYLQKNYRIRPFDNLHIRINNFEASTSDLLNSTAISSNVNIGPAQLYISSYTVNDSGYISLPVIGNYHVAGLSLNEIRQQLDTLYTPYLKFPSSVVKLTNFRITVLGEVINPGLRFIFNDKLTLMQALGHAGGLTEYANLERIKLVRETEIGTQTRYVNLKNTDFLSSEAYFLMPNDVIYVEPLRSKPFRVNAQTLSVVISAVSVTALVANIILNQLDEN